MTPMLVALALLASPGAPLYEAELIAETEDLRLPNGRHSHNHSPSVAVTPEGNLLACWFHGRGEREDNTMVVLGARKMKGDTAWRPPFVMADHPNLPDQNPTLFVDAEDRLWLFRISSLDNEQRGHFLTYLISTDYEADGPPTWTWQAPLFCFPRNLESVYTKAVNELLAAGRIPDDRLDEFMMKKEMAGEKIWHRFGWMPRQPPIMLEDGRMALGLYSDVWRCSMVAYTDDAGETWDFSPPIILPESLLTFNLQPALVQKRNGNIVAFMRARPVVRRAESSDGGMTWVDDPLDIPCPNSSVAALRLQSGNWLLVVNDQGGRRYLTAYLSDDEGETWAWKRSFETLDAGQGAAHYPAVVQAPDGDIHIVYTFNDTTQFEGRTIKHVRFNEAWVMARED